jgi:thiopurine S-methyltransferase
MELEDWGNRWRDGMIGWHQTDVSHLLAKYDPQVWNDEPIGSVYVPLCGKSLDLGFLAEHAERVLGVEYADQAIEEFFAERSLEPTIEAGPPRSYRADNYVLFAGDYYSVTSEHLGPIDAVFDRASLVALDPETRMKYVDHMRSLMATGSRMLLLTLSYDQSEMSGPPWSVSGDEVERLYAGGFDIKHLETHDVTDDQFRIRGLSTIFESAYLLTRE